MKLVKKDFLKHLMYLFIRRLYIRSYWRTPWAMPAIKHPHTIEIELTNFCNMSCVHCHRSKMDRKIGYMEMSVFTKLIDEIATYPIAFLRIVGQGESALHPRFGEMMQYAAGKSIKIELATNGAVFDLYPFDEILHWDIDILGVSVDGHDKLSYQEIRKEGNFDRLSANIRNFYAFKNNANRHYPMVCVRNVIFPGNTPKQITGFKDKWQVSTDQVTFNTLQTFKNCSTPQSIGYNRCREIFFDAHIRCDGSVLLCQHQFLYGKNEIIGNIKTDSLKKIWASKRLKVMRRLHQQKNFPLACKLCHDNIKRCAAYTNSRKYNSSRSKMVSAANKVANFT